MGNSCSNEESVNVEESPVSAEKKVKKRDPDKKQRVIFVAKRKKLIEILSFLGSNKRKS